MSQQKPMNNKEKAASYLQAASAPVPPGVEVQASVAAEALTPPDVKEPEKKVEEKPKPFMVRATRPGYFKGRRLETGDKFQVFEHELGRWMEKI